MAMSRPSEQYDPTDDLTIPGEYVATCTRVKQGIPNRRIVGGKPLIAIEFTVDNPSDSDTHGKRVSILCGESLYIDKITGRKTHYLNHAEQMGVVNPMRGFDPVKQFVGKRFMIAVEAAASRCYVACAVPYDETQHQEDAPVKVRKEHDALHPDSGNVPF